MVKDWAQNIFSQATQSQSRKTYPTGAFCQTLFRSVQDYEQDGVCAVELTDLPSVCAAVQGWENGTNYDFFLFLTE